MAAHDDKISDNRRRLFKALSAAPVVMTLRPGSALANTSAYQCLATDTTTDFIPEPSATTCTGEEGCFAYQLLTYWEVPTSSSCSLGGQTIVEVSSRFYTLSGLDVTTSVWKDGVNLDIVIGGGCNASAYQDIPPKQGYFLVLVEPVDAGGASVSGTSGEAVNIVPAGVYPKTQHAGNFQGITQTCLLSINPGATADFVKLTSG